MHRRGHGHLDRPRAPRLTSPEPIRLALAGAGVFARRAHAPALRALRDRFRVVAVYSRRRERARALAAELPDGPDACCDLGALLAREDVEALDLVLPIPALPGAVRAALAAGKHVLSEKPIAPDLATGRELLGTAGRGDRVWMIGESFRYAEAFEAAAGAVARGEIGAPRLAQLAWCRRIGPGHPYYDTEWRRSGDVPGGFLLDGGVHHAALLRMVVGEVAEVRATSGSLRPDLPPADTLSASLRFEGGSLGSYLACYALDAPFGSGLSVAGERGVLRVSPDRLEVEADGRTRARAFPDRRDVERGLAAFADAVRTGRPHRSPPREALRDLALVEALLRSARTGRAECPEAIDE